MSNAISSFRLLASSFLLSFAALASCFAQSQVVSTPLSTSALAPDRLVRIDRVLQQFVDQDRVAGAVALVLRDGKPAYEKAF
ncbi:MAG: serine hydrolase, partial [Bryobacterales bacterium]|nr:serine hydrolase [Bryobacterales bacterium]